MKAKHLQCLNGITNKNIVVLGARLAIPPDGFSCPPGWRNATPGSPEPARSPDRASSDR